MKRNEKLKLYKELQLLLAAAITVGSANLDVKAATSINPDIKAYATEFDVATAGIGIELVSEDEKIIKKNRKERRAEKRK